MDVPPKRTTYKYCLVPTCSATTIKNPSKRFISVPLREPRRSAWLTAIRYFGNISSKTHHHVCEDHFNLEEDADNYTKLTFFPESRVVLKAHVIPHIFECQPSESEEQPVQEQLSTHRARSSLSKNPFFSLTKRSSTIRSAASWSKKQKNPVVVVKVQDSDSSTPFLSNQHSPETVLPYKLSNTSGSTDRESDSDEVPHLKVVIPTKQLTPESHLNVKDFSKYSKTSKKRKTRLKQPKTAVLEKDTQTDFEKCSIGVMARPLIRSEFVQCDLGSQKANVIDSGTSP